MRPALVKRRILPNFRGYKVGEGIPASADKRVCQYFRQEWVWPDRPLTMPDKHDDIVDDESALTFSHLCDGKHKLLVIIVDFWFVIDIDGHYYVHLINSYWFVCQRFQRFPNF